MKQITDFLNLPTVQRVIRVALASLVGLGIGQLDLSYLDAWTYDLRVRITPATTKTNNVKIIEITPNDVELLNGEPRAEHFAKLLKHLSKSKPHSVLFLNNMHAVEGSEAAFNSIARDAKKFEKIYFTLDDLIIKGQESEIQLPPPLDNIPVHMNLLTSDDQNFSKDSVTRRVILSNNKQPFIHHMIAKDFNEIENPSSYKGRFNYLTSEQTLIDFRPTGTYPKTSFITVMEGAFNPEDYDGKIVLIGRNTEANTTDYKTTPYSREITAMSNLEVHANIFDTLIKNTAPSNTSKSLNTLLTILICIVTVFSVFTLRPSTGLTVLLVTLGFYLATAYFSYFFFRLILPITQPLLAIFICYYFFIPYRLIMENRKSWQYYQHNKLLSEVEELKTNFLRMMSHDLKTPLARIQGMTDIALRESEALSTLQKQALGNIKSSSSELTSLIESILNLTRIESHKVNLQLQSKDINSILKKVCDKCDFLAKEKNIQVITEFEPMFAVKVDESLLTQVFTNLVENAIKYSPEDSKILVSTEEENGKIKVQVADQGYGINKSDLENVFEKFYRSVDDNTVNIKGTGLGLYLSKYFVNLHDGDIYAESEPEQGSTFTVELPMDLEKNDKGVKNV